MNRLLSAHVRYICGVALSTLLLSAGCSERHQPAAPGAVDGGLTPTAPTQTACEFSALAQAGRVYTFVESPLPTVAAYTRCSRFVLYDSGVFELQFGASGAYAGTYRVVDRVVDFTWAGTSTAGPWQSDATLDGDRLTVHYNVIMRLTDFEDAVYQRSN
jgi:hypothetical protein